MGNVQVEPGPGDADREVMHLVAVRRLSPAAMVQVRRHVRALDKRAYRVARPVYGALPALERLP